jgi:hypothetical protein
LASSFVFLHQPNTYTAVVNLKMAPKRERNPLTARRIICRRKINIFAEESDASDRETKQLLRGAAAHGKNEIH